MRILDIGKFESSIVLHFDTEDTRINAYTFASTIVALADAAKAANATINPGCEIEVVVEALGPGSFRARIRALYSSSRNLFANQVVLGLVLGVLGNYIYDRTLKADETFSIRVNTNEVIVTRGNDRLIVPRSVYDATRRAEKNPEFVKAMTRTFSAIAADEKVTSFGLVGEMDSPIPTIPISRSILLSLATNVPEDPDIRVVTEHAELQIVKAILKKSNRKWEFVWRGITISAPVLHEQFYVEFFAHEITIAPGDTLEVTLAIKQSRDPNTGIFTNVGYEVAEVHGHVPRIRQMPLPDSTDERK